MSTIYLTEPPTSGKVLLKTTYGDIDIELWSKEAPLACRNFVQLCLEGYYDNCPVHRVIKGFMMQTGDPTGTGLGGESVWGKPFKDEFHSRIKFNHRGQVAMANEQKPNSNHSQFFITLDSTEWLNRKHTIFGKVTGVTMFNLLKLNDAEVGEQDKPLESINIVGCEVLMNPFDDIVPRALSLSASSAASSSSASGISNNQNARKATRDLKLLSFEEEEDETGGYIPNIPSRQDNRRSSKATKAADNPHTIVNSSVPSSFPTSSDAADVKSIMLSKLKASQHHQEQKVATESPRDGQHETPVVAIESDKSKEFREMREALLRSKRAVKMLTAKDADSCRNATVKETTLTPLESLKQNYLKRKVNDGDREQQTLARLESFSKGLKMVKTSGESSGTAPEAVAYHGQVTEVDLLAGTDQDWHMGKLKFRSHIDDKLRASDGRKLDDYVVLDDRKHH